MVLIFSVVEFCIKNLIDLLSNRIKLYYIKVFIFIHFILIKKNLIGFNNCYK